MKTVIFIFFTTFFSVALRAQVYFVAFTDKETSDTSKALKTLSERAIERRISQKVSIDSLDFPVNKSYVDSISQYEVRVKQSSKWLNGILIETQNQEVISEIGNINFVSYIHDLSASSFGGILTTQADEEVYGETTKATKFLELDYYHDQGFLGEAIMISFFDAGFPGVDTITAFKHLFSRDLIRDTYNVVENTKVVYKSNEHGTNVASITLALDSGQFVGASPYSDVAFYITENINSETIEEEYNWVIGAERADSAGTDIINSSLGYQTFDSDASSHTFSELDGETAVISLGAKIASSRGILVVNSAGNSGNSDFWPYVGFPADAEEVLTVGSVNFNGEKSGFSSWGVNADYQKPELVAPGTSIKIIKADGSIRSSSGTSFSAPLIAGYASVFWQKNRSLSSQELKSELISLGSNGMNPTAETGFGYPTLNINSIEGVVKGKEIIKSELYDLNGKKAGENPTDGLYISITTYSDQSVTRGKVLVRN